MRAALLAAACVVALSGCSLGEAATQPLFCTDALAAQAYRADLVSRMGAQVGPDHYAQQRATRCTAGR